MTDTTSDIGSGQARRLIAALALVFVTLTASSPMAQAQAPRIDRISPVSARPGDRVALDGAGFGAIAVRVTVDGIRAAIVGANGNRVTFAIPAGVRTGAVVVTAVNPGGHVASVELTILEGTLLAGAPGTPIANALRDLPPVGVPNSDIVDGVIMTRLSARLRANATVGQVNAALARVEAGVVSMHPATLSVTLAVPRQQARAALEQLALTLKAQPGVSGAWPAIEAMANYSRFDTTPELLTAERFLLPSRFPAAWNAFKLVVDELPDGSLDCRHPKVSLLVADVFGTQVPEFFTQLIPTFRAADPSEPAPDAANHGYQIAVTAAGPKGANPFSECLDVQLIQMAGLDGGEGVQRIAQHLPTGRFIVNYSMGYPDRCPNGQVCRPPQDGIVVASKRASDAVAWKELSIARWDDFLMVTAAGNEKDASSAAIWPGVADARVNSAFAFAAKSDPLMGLAADNGLWTPAAAELAQGFESLAGTAAEQARLADDVRSRQLDGSDTVPGNVLVVGSTTNMPSTAVSTQRIPPEQLVESGFSDRHADLLAVGEQLFDTTAQGTSYSAPQVAGLASYLWLLSTELRYSQPASTTRHAIFANRRANVIDAYASALSLDEATMPRPDTAPVRLAIMDVNGDGGFTEADIEAHLKDYFFVDANGIITREPPPIDLVTLKRSDLNGDGFSTSISRRERFDLDREGSVQFGATSYGFVTQDIEGQEVRYDEGAVTDLEILCYYAYSDLYGGNPDARTALLAGRCAMAITPTIAALNAGQTLQFTATSPAGGAITWSATGGTVSNTGLFTAGTTGGTFAVTAASAGATAAAAVTITAAPGGARLTGTLSLAGDRSQSAPTASQVDHAEMTATITVAVTVDSAGRQIIAAAGNSAVTGVASATRQLHVSGCLDRQDVFSGNAVSFSNTSFGAFATSDLVVTVFVSGTDDRTYSWTEPAPCDGSGTRPATSSSTVTRSSSPYSIELQLRGTVRRSADGRTILAVDFERDTITGTPPADTLTLVTRGRLDPVP